MNLAFILFKDGMSFGTDTLMGTPINDAAPMVLSSLAGPRPLVHNFHPKEVPVFLKGAKFVFNDKDVARGRRRFSKLGKILPVTVMLPDRRCRPRAISL